MATNQDAGRFVANCYSINVRVARWFVKCSVQGGNVLSELNGYAGKVLMIDLSTGKYFNIPTQEYASRYLGGRGIAAKIYWDEVPAGVRPFDSENCLLLFTGPLCGIPRLAGSRWTVCGKSPATEPEHFS